MKDYINSGFYINQRNDKLINKYILIVLIIIIILFGLSNIMKYKVILVTKAIVVKEDKYYLKMYLKDDEIKKYLYNRNIIILNKKYSYKINSISSEYIIDETMSKYREIKIDINLDKNLKINNNIVEIRKLYKKEPIINILTNKLKGE